MFFVDDKAIIPFGEPERPLSLQMFEHVVELLHHETLGALDLDFHSCGLVPSVVPKSDAPDNVNYSFYKGTIFRGKYRKLVLGNSKFMRK